MLIGTGFIIVLLFQEKYLEVIPLVPLVYGLSLISAAKHTNNIVKPLGYLQVIAGLLCIQFSDNIFWCFTIGFGLVHLIYGSVIYFKYDNKN